MKRLITFACGLALIGACSGCTRRARARTNWRPRPATRVSATRTADARGDERRRSRAGDRAADAAAAATVEPAYRDVTLPAGTVLPVDLETAVGSDISRVEQPVSGRLRRAVTVDGVEVLAAGTVVSGHVTAAQRPGKVKGRGMIAMRFTQLDTPGAGTTRDQHGDDLAARAGDEEEGRGEDRRAGRGRRRHRRHRRRQGRRGARARSSAAAPAPATCSRRAARTCSIGEGRGPRGEADRARHGPRAGAVSFA